MLKVDRKLLLLLVSVFVVPVHQVLAQQQIEGKVVKVSDGDTFIIYDGQQQHKIRIAQIDAPERAQSGGKDSRAYLNSLIYSRLVIVETNEKDRYGRVIGEVFLGQMKLNVGAEMVKKGHAWVYDRYVKDRYLYRLQEAAKNDQLGLWALSDPVRPWEYRKSKK